MKCPVCSVELKMAERQGVEIDYCSQCRGIWLNRGELDKIVERSSAMLEPQDYEVASRIYPGKDFVDKEGRKREGDDYKGRKRKSFLSELFDF